MTGKDRTSYLQGLLTNDVLGLTTGTGCYAAWLTPQGRMLTDLHVFESGDMMLLDVPAALVQTTLERLDQFLFGEDVQLTDLSEALRAIWIHGNAAPGVVERVTGLAGLDAWSEYRNVRADVAGSPAVVARVSQLGVPGFCIYVAPDHEDSVRRALESAGASVADPVSIEAARVEAGYPVFGVDMTEETIPLEAGIEDRAISLTKGCYVGQEVIIRVLHRGHGRVVKRLVGLRVDGGVPSSGARILSGDREIGKVTSAARSSGLGPIALGYVHRDFVSPGTHVEVEDKAGRLPAVVSARPIGS